MHYLKEMYSMYKCFTLTRSQHVTTSTRPSDRGFSSLLSLQLHVVHIKEPYGSLAEAEHDMAGIALLSFLFEVPWRLALASFIESSLRGFAALVDGVRKQDGRRSVNEGPSSLIQSDSHNLGFKEVRLIRDVDLHIVVNGVHLTPIDTFHSGIITGQKQVSLI